LLDREAVIEDVELDLATRDASDIGRFDIASEPDAFEIFTDNTENGRLRIQRADAAQIPMNYGSTNLQSSDIARWLDQELFRDLDFLTQAQRYAYFLRVVERLISEKQQSIGQLAEARFALAKRVLAKLEDIRDQACKASFKQYVLDENWLIELDSSRSFAFGATSYPVSPMRRYQGRHRFKKHYYPSIADLRAEGEEFDCAVAIDGHPQVSMWIRNLDFPPGFSLPTSLQNFYPDFLVKLHDGRVVVVEYKGAHLRDTQREIEKRAVGTLWAKKSKGEYNFGFVFKTGDRGESLKEQLDALIAQ
jgi:type III restriction enzyme